MPEVPKKMLVTSELEKSLIFQSLMKLRLPLRICSNNIEYMGYIERLEDDAIVVRISAPTIGSIEGTVRTNFVFHSNYHYFSSSVKQLEDNLYLLVVPDQIFKNMMRMYERVDVFGKVFMKFRIIIRVKKHDINGISLLANERMLLQEVKKPRPAVEKILNGIKTLVSEYSQSFQLKIFKEGEALSLEEQMVKETKKIFLLYNAFEDTIEEKRFLDEDVLTVGKIFEMGIAKGEPRKAVEARLLDFLDRKRRARIFSECLVPLMVEGDVAGCLRLANDVDYHRSIKPAFALKAVEYVNILVEALVKYDYFNLKSGDEFKIPVVNISAGGLLFRLEDSRLKGYILRGTNLIIALLFPDRQIAARGVVYRIDEAGEAEGYAAPERREAVGTSFGVKFQEISDEDMKFIDNLNRQPGPSSD